MRLNMTEISQNIFMTEKNSQHYQERNFMEREIISIVFKENHEWSYEPLSDENQLEVLAMLME